MKSNVRNVLQKLMIMASSFLLFLPFLDAQNAHSHLIFDKNMKKSSFKKILKKCAKADVIFFGEVHSDPIAHWLELKLLQNLHSAGNVVLGLEMFERDNQDVLEKFVQGDIDEEDFEASARLWKNFKTDYLTLLNYAKENNIDCVATNIPRTYATLVYKEGFDVLNGLVEEELKYIAPLPIPYDPELKSYKEMLDMVEGHGGENFPKAQAIKDATMAHSISESFVDGKKYIHLNGSYHSDNFEGIVWYLQKYRPELNVITISSIPSNMDAINKNEIKGKADFVVIIDETMTQTY